MKKTILTLFLINLFILPLYAQTFELASGKLSMTMDNKTGGVLSIVNSMDKDSMNFIMNPDVSLNDRRTSRMTWGLGFCSINGERVEWKNVSSVKKSKDVVSFTYTMGKLNIMVTRKAEYGKLTECYKFTNKYPEPVNLSDIGIYTPVNRNHRDSGTRAESGCNAFVWTGNSSSYVFAQRIRGEADHLGLVLTEGSIKSYETLNNPAQPGSTGASDARGTIVLNTVDMHLKSGESYTLCWTLFACDNRDEFYNQALLEGFVKVSASDSTATKDQTITVSFLSSKPLKNVACFLDGKETGFTQNENTVTTEVEIANSGNQTIELRYGKGKSTLAKVSDLLPK